MTMLQSKPIGTVMWGMLMLLITNRKRETGGTGGG